MNEWIFFLNYSHTVQLLIRTYLTTIINV